MRRTAVRRKELGSARRGLTHHPAPLSGAQVRRVPMGRLTGGVLHSKFWVVDGRHVYVGSANMDWRSLTQVSPQAPGGEALWSSSALAPRHPRVGCHPGGRRQICDASAVETPGGWLLLLSHFSRVRLCATP